MKHRGTMEHMAVMSHESCHDHLNCIHHESRPKTDGDGDWWTHIREQFYLKGLMCCGVFQKPSKLIASIHTT